MNLKLPALLCALLVIESNAGLDLGCPGPGNSHLPCCRWDDDRRLDELDITELDNCSNEIYQVSVVTIGSSKAHVALVAKPQCNELKGESCTCPLLSFDTGADDNGNVDNTMRITTYTTDDKASLNLDSFPLSTILDAFTTASVKNSGTEYDFLVNNCATFIISMGLELGIDPSDTKIISFIAQQISSEFILNQLSEVDAGKVHTDIYDGQNDAVVVEDFISNYIHERI